jgi:hypothetical protein
MLGFHSGVIVQRITSSNPDTSLAFNNIRWETIATPAVLDVAVPVEANVLQLAGNPTRIVFSLLIRIDDS